MIIRSENIIISGRVLKGEGLANSTGYPTANLSPALIKKHQLKTGVYAAWGTIGQGRRRPAIVVVGSPNKRRRRGIKLEVYFLSLKKPIRGKTITVEIVKKIRPIYYYKSVAPLLKHIKKDIIKAKKILHL
ncbi:MAG: riboflavin kinase [Patescibacteria group bacterium]